MDSAFREAKNARTAAPPLPRRSEGLAHKLFGSRSGLAPEEGNFSSMSGRMTAKEAAGIALQRQTAREAAQRAGGGAALAYTPSPSEAEQGPTPKGAADTVLDEGEGTDALESRARKIHAKAFIESRLESNPADGTALVALLEQAVQQFGLTDLILDMRGKMEARIGIVASPTLWCGYLRNKLIGNLLSDWLVWGAYGSVSEASRWIQWKKPKSTDATEVIWGPLTGRGFGSYMLADPLTAIGPPGRGPTVTNPTWDVLTRRKQKGNGRSTYYVRGHLLNDNLHGPGDDWKNLTPLSQRTNNHSPNGHLRSVEDVVKREVGKKETLAYQVIPKYGRSPWKWPRYLVHAIDYVQEAGDVLAAEDHVPTGLYCKVWTYDVNGGRKLLLKKWVPQLDISKPGETEYWVDTPAGGIVNISDPGQIWSVIELAFMSAVGGLLAYGSIDLAELLAQYCASVGVSVVDFLVSHQFNVSTVAGVLSGYLSRGRDSWPKDPERK
ncbi:DNA/RNA non-specific endonuclease [Sorangium sp. So ce117]|uniref:DNA/RNA non-specific endonuclease n=1 Tax=Sorangium sp. So ce117 TaxID=3133277 RepID=UPI003F5E0288